MISKFEIFFSRLFDSIILENEIVSTILYVISKNMDKLKTNIDKTLNNDI